MKTMHEVLGDGYPGLSATYYNARTRLVRVAARTILTAEWDPNGAIGVVTAKHENSEGTAALQGRLLVSAFKSNSWTTDYVVTAALRGTLGPMDLEVDLHRRVDTRHPIWLRLSGTDTLQDVAMHMQVHAAHLAERSRGRLLEPVNADVLKLACENLVALAQPAPRENAAGLL